MQLIASRTTSTENSTPDFQCTTKKRNKKLAHLGNFDIPSARHQHLHGALGTKVGFQHFLKTLRRQLGYQLL